jgi:hypothetical protein
MPTRKRLSTSAVLFDHQSSGREYTARRFENESQKPIAARHKNEFFFELADC